MKIDINIFASFSIKGKVLDKEFLKPEDNSINSSVISLLKEKIDSNVKVGLTLFIPKLPNMSSTRMCFIEVSTTLIARCM